LRGSCSVTRRSAPSPQPTSWTTTWIALVRWRLSCSKTPRCLPMLASAVFLSQSLILRARRDGSSSGAGPRRGPCALRQGLVSRRWRSRAGHARAACGSGSDCRGVVELARVEMPDAGHLLGPALGAQLRVARPVPPGAEQRLTTSGCINIRCPVLFAVFSLRPANFAASVAKTFVGPCSRDSARLALRRLPPPASFSARASASSPRPRSACPGCL
jgi:hypothetical protein